MAHEKILVFSAIGNYSFHRPRKQVFEGPKIESAENSYGILESSKSKILRVLDYSNLFNSMKIKTWRNII